MRQLSILSGGIVFVLVAAINAAALIGRIPVNVSINQPVDILSSQWVSLMVDRGFEVGLSDNHDRWTVFEAERELGWEIFLADQETGSVQQLTNHFASDRFPVLSPDSQQVAFVTWRDSNPEVYVLDLTSSELQNISTHLAIDMLTVWSPDSSMLAFVSERDGNAEIYLWDAAHNLLRNLTRHPAHDTSPRWSPDGTFITFRSNRSGKQIDYQMVVGDRHSNAFVQSSVQP